MLPIIKHQNMLVWLFVFFFCSPFGVNIVTWSGENQSLLETTGCTNNFKILDKCLL